MLLLLLSHKSTHLHADCVWESAMGEENNRSSEAPKGTEEENSRPSGEGREGIIDGKIDEDDEQRRVSSDSNSDCAVGNSSKASEKETLALVECKGDLRVDFDESSHLLSEVPVEYSLQPLQSDEELKSDANAVQEESLKALTGQSARALLQLPNGPSMSEPAPTSVSQSISSIPSGMLPEEKLQPAQHGNIICLAEQDNQNSPKPKPLSIIPMLKTPSDGYNWRKYGQKQVKSPEGSRSYYRCTFSDCFAKKIECCDRSNRHVETVYRSPHNHDPPQKLNCSRENKPSSPVIPVNASTGTKNLVRCVNDPVPSTPSKESLPETDAIRERKQESSSGSDETIEINMEEHADGPEFKRRQKRNSTSELDSVSKPGKKPKYVVHAPYDVGISGDGYRWRKYGQKTVKGNPHPRNYYRCTSAGCPVRKHIETAVDNTNAVVITYKGVHDHDAPVPRKRHPPKNALMVATTSPISPDNMQNKIKPHKIQTEWAVDKEVGLAGDALNAGGDKASASARPLLSIGFEIKPC